MIEPLHSAIVGEHIPVKQGLRLFHCHSGDEFKIRVGEHIPVKQGLRRTYLL